MRESELAGNLVRHGVTKGDRISVYTRNPLVSALLMFGIWKAGAVYCPINFSYTGRQVRVEFDDPANLVYTSGTTGPAKGVVQPYRWMAQYTHGLRLGVCQDDVIYNDLPMYHVGGAIANVARAAWVGCEVAVWDRFSPSEFIEVSIRNERDEECDPGEVGQLAFRSRLPSLLFTSYLGKPDATATALRNTWFHTGDAAVLGDDGLLYFVDRLGDRLRVRGENVSSFQVEDLLLGHEAIQLCAVFGVPGAEGDEDDLVACIVPAPEHRGLTEQEVRAYAEANLPKFMRPRLIRIVDELPRTPTNKVEKYKLRQRVLAELAIAKD